MSYFEIRHNLNFKNYIRLTEARLEKMGRGADRESRSPLIFCGGRASHRGKAWKKGIAQR
jgi:hypothetical protein